MSIKQPMGGHFVASPQLAKPVLGCARCGTNWYNSGVARTALFKPLADFPRIDDFIAVAAERGAPRKAAESSAAELASWLDALPGAQKDALLFRAAQCDLRVGGE